MEIQPVIEALTILQKYNDKVFSPSGTFNARIYYDLQALECTLLVRRTHSIIKEPDLSRLIELGWFQYENYEDLEENPYEARQYDINKRWACFI